mmetsp:Transcript_125440/g.313393  ORF Transcript_125440/g.313393 Transcript_125440/m.313393 type:complete len:219 (-) Transcript_125440:401-1057(-)
MGPLKANVGDARDSQVAPDEGVEALQDILEDSCKDAIPLASAAEDLKRNWRWLPLLFVLRFLWLIFWRESRPIYLDQGWILLHLLLWQNREAHEAKWRAEEEVVVDREHSEDLGGAEEDEIERHGEHRAGDDGVDRLMEREDPTEALLLHKGHDRLVDKGLQHTDFQPDPEQGLDGQRPVLHALGTQKRIREALTEVVEAVARGADWPERLGREIGSR